jgi:hypothetical protein
MLLGLSQQQTLNAIRDQLRAVWRLCWFVALHALQQHKTLDWR